MVNSETGAAALTNEGGTKKTMTAGELTILILAIGMTLLSILVAAKCPSEKFLNPMNRL